MLLLNGTQLMARGVARELEPIADSANAMTQCDSARSLA